MNPLLVGLWRIELWSDASEFSYLYFGADDVAFDFNFFDSIQQGKVLFVDVVPVSPVDPFEFSIERLGGTEFSVYTRLLTAEYLHLYRSDIDPTQVLWAGYRSNLNDVPKEMKSLMSRHPKVPVSLKSPG